MFKAKIQRWRGAVWIDKDEQPTYVALRIVGSVPDGLLAVILALVPGCDRGGWGYEFAMPHRPLAPNEQVWSNMMDPTVAAELLEG